MREKDLEHEVVPWAVRFAEGRVERRLTRIGQGSIDIRPMFDEKLAQLPMPVERGAVEVQIISERISAVPREIR